MNFYIPNEKNYEDEQRKFKQRRRKRKQRLNQKLGIEPDLDKVKAQKKSMRPVCHGEKHYNSIAEASRETGIAESTIRSWCKINKHEWSYDEKQ